MPAVRQIANVATLPGIVGASVALPDVHAGYGFAIGNVAAFDVADPTAIVSPGGVGFDINCGVRLVRTNLHRDDVLPLQTRLADAIFARIPVGVGGSAAVRLPTHEMAAVLEGGMHWAVEAGVAWPEDALNCEDGGRLPVVTWRDVSERAVKRGINQLGTLGAGNHYVEVQYVSAVYDAEAAAAMGIGEVGQVCVMIHCGSRGLGHQVAADAVDEMEAAVADFVPIDRQLACAPIASHAGTRYLSAMSAAANFAFANRAKITQLLREAFVDVFGEEADALDMHVVYDVAHNVAKFEDHVIDGQERRLLVHRKGATRAFGPGHADLPPAYASVGQPVLVGGSMGTCSYVLVGTEGAMQHSFGSTCHGAGRAASRNACRRTRDPADVLADLEARGICVRVANPALIAEEAPESYKNVDDVVDVCVAAQISKRVVQLRPFCVIKG